MSGEYIINPLEPKAWSDGTDSDVTAPEAFRRVTRLSQHVAFLKDFFRAYKDFDDAQIDTMKNHILETYQLPLLRFATNGSREREALSEKLKEIMPRL